MAVGQRKRPLCLLLMLVIYTFNLYIGYSYYWEENITVIDAIRMQTSLFSRKSKDILKVDVYFENHVSSCTADMVTTIAIGCGITSKGVENVDTDNIAAKFQLFNSLLPTFCKTATPGYNYRFYIAYDFTDPVFTDPLMLDAFKKAFINQTRWLCDEPRNIKSSLHMVQCIHSKKPTWAQNAAMMEAYLDHVDYYYRVNDDTEMDTDGWLEAFITTLKQYNPPHVGVVGPNHTGGNTNILTYDFVHRTHVDIFGFYYPRIFYSWWADVWITAVYKPNHFTKLNNIGLTHTIALGQRYENPSRNVVKLSIIQLKRDKEILNW